MPKFMYCRICSLTVVLLGLQIPTQALTVAIDAFHNDESNNKYLYDNTTDNGTSKFAELLVELGHKTATITDRITADNLAGVDILIIVDPDTPQESPDPKVIEDAEGDAIEKWVRDGGGLMLLANNKGMCEFEHLNRLAKRFGIVFNEDTQADGPKYDPVPESSVLPAGVSVYMNDISTIKVSSPAQSEFTYKGDVLMASATIGLGKVFAVGDPWLYNEHIDRQDNRKCVIQLLTHYFGKPVDALIRDWQPTAPPNTKHRTGSINFGIANKVFTVGAESVYDIRGAVMRGNSDSRNRFTGATPGFRIVCNRY